MEKPPVGFLRVNLIRAAEIAKNTESESPLEAGNRVDLYFAGRSRDSTPENQNHNAKLDSSFLTSRHA